MRKALKTKLLKSTDPGHTITTFQQSHSLHTMMAQAFGTTPSHMMQSSKKDDGEMEPLDTDSVLAFLSQLGVRTYGVHKRVTDALLKDLVDEIQKTDSTENLEDMLSPCLKYATTVVEFRQIVQAILKRLGDKTPKKYLIALAERNEANELSHLALYKTVVPNDLKRLVWEADWEQRITNTDVTEPDVFLKQAQNTLLFETLEPAMNQYMLNRVLVESANKPFVASVRECRISTSQRRTQTSVLNPGKPAGASGIGRLGNSQNVEILDSGQHVNHLKGLLSESGGSSSAYRPKLLYSLLSVLIARHGKSKAGLLGGAQHLHCTLVADILLSTGGPLPSAYQDIVILARVLDDCVQEGTITNSNVSKIQDALRSIFKGDDDGVPVSPQKNEAKTMKTGEQTDLPGNSIQRQLDRIITSGINAMKEADVRNLFLNPVTDNDAPDYSKVIKKPMCISMMESKVDSHEYKSPSQWEEDVKLMFKNCLDYNRPPGGTWYIKEAQRQLRVFKAEIAPEARRLYQAEVAKRTAAENSSSRKRNRDDDAPVLPLEAANKKRKQDHNTHDEFIPSIPALAFMLVSDPFVVRIVIARVLRELHRGVLVGRSLPVAHASLPSLLQFLHMANWSSRVCSIGARLYAIPDTGESLIGESNDPVARIPFVTLRCLLPLLLRLHLEADLDRETVYGGSLYDADQSNPSLRPKPIPASMWVDGERMRVAVSLLEGELVYICQPDNTTEDSLSKTFPRYATALKDLSSSFLDDRVFFGCLVNAIRRHKHKITKATRDAILASWMSWLSSKTSSKKGTMVSAAHEGLVMLLNEWHKMGNQVLPRDDCVRVAADAVESTNESETRSNRKFSALWSSPIVDFEPIKSQYLKMLEQFPSQVSQQWMADHELTMKADSLKSEEEPEDMDTTVS